MKKRIVGSIIIAFWGSKYKLLLLYSFWIVTSFVVCFLYNLPLEAVSYATLITTSGTLLFLGIDFLRFYKKHQQLEGLKKSITLHLATMPQPSGLIERDYQDLLVALNQDKASQISEWRMKMTDLMDYYTLWTHQIKTPIAAMHLLLQESPNAQDPQLVQELFKIERYVELAIQYARLESMSSDLRIEVYDLNEIVTQAIKKYATFFIAKKIKLEYEALTCTVLTDQKWLVFAIEQILSNALKYTPSGTISIYMAPHEQKTLVIKDTGIGIQSEDLPRIFEKGFTGYNGRMDKKSTGIGLNLCKKVLDRLSHPITITSEVGVGTQVSLDLSTKVTDRQ